MFLSIAVFSLLVLLCQCSGDCYLSDKTSHHLSSVAIEDIVQLNNVLKSRTNIKQLFNKINLVRPVGSDNHAAVRHFIKDYLTNMKWNVDETPFTEDTIIGPMKFVNIIGTQNVTKSRRLVLACHYDTLKKDDFVGSIDSALPCAMMLSVAEFLTPLLKRNNQIDVSLELIFFDGEEAFVQWSATDSLYGSRYLASLWSSVIDKQQCSRLKTIDTMILLDLLGGNDPKFYNFNTGNSRLFESFTRIESTIIQQQNVFKDTHHPYFHTYSIDSVVQDDHVPFMERGVPIVHLIPLPFPAQWHKTSDNGDGINWKTTKDLELILSVFIVQYFHLGDLLPSLDNIES